MGFYELGNGCDSCDTIQSILPNNVNMQMDPNSSVVASMVMPYGTQNNIPRQYNSAIASGYSAQGSNMGYGGMGSNGSTLGGGATTATTMVVVPTTTGANQNNKQVVASGPVAVVVPTNNANNNSTKTTTAITEGFTDNANASMDPRKWIILGLVVFSALALNECCKYFLNKSLQLNDGSPLYYVAYAGVAVLLTWAVYTYISKN
jgi:hypothetical protein